MSPITPQEILARAHALHEDVRQWRRTIHQHPELSFNEIQTGRMVAGILHDLGIEATTGVAKTGVVGHIEGNGNTTVGLRADMDALPIYEENDTDFNSKNTGLMHACGHDAHTAILLGASTLLKGFADEGRLPGNVRLLFQPSEENRDEENKSGGFRMVEEGAMDGIDAVFGLHVDTATEVGKVGTRAGAMMAAGDIFDITIRGFGGHGARPHLAVDPILLAAQVIQAANHVVSRRINPLASGVISICMLNAGRAHNVIPDTVTLSGTCRSMTSAVRQQLQDELRRACAIVEPLGGSFELNFKHGYPALVNEPVATQTAFNAVGAVLGNDNVFEVEPIMASEDFSFMLEKSAGCYLRLGVRNPAWEREYPVHTSTFRIDEDALPVGVASLVATTVEWMTKQGK